MILDHSLGVQIGWAGMIEDCCSMHVKLSPSLNHPVLIYDSAQIAVHAMRSVCSNISNALR